MTSTTLTAAAKDTALLGDLESAYTATDAKGTPWIILKRKGSGQDSHNVWHGYTTPQFRNFREGREYWFAYRQRSCAWETPAFGGTLTLEGFASEYHYGRFLAVKTWKGNEQEWEEVTVHGCKDTRREVVDSIASKTGGLSRLARLGRR